MKTVQFIGSEGQRSLEVMQATGEEFLVPGKTYELEDELAAGLVASTQCWKVSAKTAKTETKNESES